MKPVDMTIMHDPPAAHGDCFRCVIASILELPPAEVPHFSALSSDSAEERRLVREWLAPRGLYYFEIEWEVDALKNWKTELDFHHVLSGISPRGIRHACVGFAAEVIHDPHPSRAGIEPDDGKYLLGFICKL
jgi:hypothetical protein